MANIDAQVVLRATSGLPRDNAVNVYHFTGTGSDYQGLANAIRSAYVTHLALILGDTDGIQVKIYNSDGAPPNPPLYVSSFTAIEARPGGPREVALCLSQSGSPALSGRAPGLLATERGRTYIGPLGSQELSVDRPDVGQANRLLDLGAQIKSTAPAGFLWSAGSSRVEVSRIWVDNEWDTQRRRGFRPTQRTSRAI